MTTIDIASFKGRGLSGLGNLGNTCYMNSILQCLSHTYELHPFLEAYKLNKLHINEGIDAVMLQELVDVYATLWSSNCKVMPKRFLSQFQRLVTIKGGNLQVQFGGLQQNDATEFLNIVLDTLHDATKRPVSMTIRGKPENEKDIIAVKSYEMLKSMYETQYSPIVANFFNIQVSRIFDFVDGRPNISSVLSIRPEPIMTINLPIPKPEFVRRNHVIRGNPSPMIDIYDCLDLYTMPELLTGDNQWFNESLNKKQDVARQTSFFQLADIVIIDLKRFSMHYGKIQHSIDFPLEGLDLNKYVISSGSYIYDLYAVCNHYGGLGGGHYTAFVRVGGDKWWEFNDTNVREVPDKQVSSCASYCLFYRRRR
jgi:ubiquitin C-terminal hydrolase